MVVKTRSPRAHDERAPGLTALRRALGRQEGTAMLLAIFILGTLSLLGTGILMSSLTGRRVASYHWQKEQALAAAETGIAFAQRMIQDMNAPLEDRDKDGRPDFALTDTLAWGATYTVVAEASEVRSIGPRAYSAARFVIAAEGRRGPALRRVLVELEHDTFLKYATFVGDEDVTFADGDVVTGEVYAGGKINVPIGATRPVEFLEKVTVTKDIPNADFAVFHRGYATGAQLIDPRAAVDFDELRRRATGELSDCDCGGRGEVGIYTDLGHLVSPLGLILPVVDLGLFNFYDTVPVPGDTLVTYAGRKIANPLTKAPLTSREFNGILFFEKNVWVEGTLNGRSGKSLTLFSNEKIYVCDHIVTGHTGFDPLSGLPTGTGALVNLGLVARREIHIDKTAPRILRVDASLLSAEAKLKVEGSRSDHPAAAAGAADLDLDGIYGESPVNHDPRPGLGWNELAVDLNTWVLNLNGSLITWKRPDLGPWAEAAVVTAASGPVVRRTYDIDVTLSPPPCFPVPLNLWREVHWTEIFESERNLDSYLVL